MDEIYRTLLIDDVPAVRESLRWVFEEMNYIQIVGEAGDGHEAVQLAFSLKPDIVILDIELPGLNGYEVARHLKTMLPPPLIIFLTVHSQSECRQQAVISDADGFVEKAAGWPTLMTQVDQLLKLKQEC